MIERAVEDRRIKDKKTQPNKRKNLRREEDRKNILAYYGALLLAFSIIVTFFTISLLHN